MEVIRMRVFVIFIGIFWLSLVSMVPQPAQSATDQSTDPQLKVMVSILPQILFVERIGGAFVRVESLVQPGQNPHTYEITPRQMVELSEADIFFRVGVSFENGLIPRLKDAVPGLPIVDTRRGITLRPMEPHDDDAHESGDDDHQSGMDPHIWLSPDLIALQGRTICDALCDIDPVHKNIFLENYGVLQTDLDALKNQIKTQLADLKLRKFMVFHPSWGYFADAFNLVQISVETEGKTPSARQLARTIDRARADGIITIIVQPQFSRKSADTIAAAIGGTVLPIDPLAKDVFATLQAAANAIGKGTAQ